MAVEIGSKHHETKANLRERVRKEEIKVVGGDPTRKYTCYFCNTPIEGNARLLVDETPFQGKESTTEYSACCECYESAKHFVYHKDIPLCLN